MMMNEKMVACLKANGKVLREFKDTVYVPFGSEYSILLKNLNSARALVDIQIDGQEVCEGGLVLNANKEVDLERFIKDGNLSAGNRFKFIERTTSVEQHRGVKAEDGIIRISFRYELPRPQLPNWGGSAGQWPNYPPSVRGEKWYTKGGVSGTLGSTGDFCDTSLVGSVQCNNVATKGATRGLSNMSIGPTAVGSAQSYSASVNDVGITVAGSVSTQKFSTTTIGALETEEHVIVLRILGEIGQTPVLDPVTVTSKTKCTTCGIQNKRTAKFCSNCGTSLTII